MKAYTLFMLLLLASSSSANEVSIFNCEILDSPGTTYILEQDVIDSEKSACMDITAEDIVLDCGGHLVDGVDAEVSTGVRIVSSLGVDTNVSVRNCRINDWGRGVWTISSSNGSYTNVSISSSGSYGFFAYEGSGNVYRNVSSTMNGDRGFIFWNSSNNLFEGCNSSNNGAYGFVFNDGAASNNTVRDSRAENNWNDGFFLYFCRDNTLYNVSSINNSEGVNVFYSDGNNISHSKIERNRLYGIELTSAGGAGSNYIYDNLFNNTINYAVYPEYYINHWSINPVTGINVLGGEYVAGNYWATPSGDGFSEENNDSNSNGFCDLPQQIALENYDYFPLSGFAYNCVLEGNYAPCDEVSLNEVIALINDWANDQASLAEVIYLIDAWAG